MPFHIFTDHKNRRYRDNELCGYASRWQDTRVTAHSAGEWAGYRIGLVNIEDGTLKLQLSGKTVADLFVELACIDYFKNSIKPEYLESFQKDKQSKERPSEEN
jgi:hypothetical protein